MPENASKSHLSEKVREHQRTVIDFASSQSEAFTQKTVGLDMSEKYKKAIKDLETIVQPSQLVTKGVRRAAFHHLRVAKIIELSLKVRGKSYFELKRGVPVKGQRRLAVDVLLENGINQNTFIEQKKRPTLLSKKIKHQEAKLHEAKRKKERKEEMSQSVRTVSGGLPTLGKR